MKKTTTKQNVSKNVNDKTKTADDTLLKNEILPIIVTPIIKTRRGPNKSWDDLFTERRKSRRLNNLPPLDIKTEIKEEIIDIDSVLMQENDPNSIMSSSFSPNESHVMINHGDNNINTFPKENLNTVEKNFQPIKDSYNTQNAVIFGNVTNKTNVFELSGNCNNYINSHDDKPKYNNINDELKPVILECWSYNESHGKTNVIDELNEIEEISNTQCCDIIQTQSLQNSDGNVKAEISSSPTTTINTVNIHDKDIAYFKMGPKEKKLYRKKYNFVTALGLISIEKFNEIMRDKELDRLQILNNNSLNSKNSKVNMIPCHQPIPETIRRSYLLQYTKETTNSKNQRHIAIPVLVPERTSGSSFHPGRPCTIECSSCHGKFGSLDTPYHIAQIKNLKRQKECLEIVSHLIGPKSCLCLSCFNTVQKKIIRKEKKNSCMVWNCEQLVTQTFNSPFLYKIKMLLNKEGIDFKFWENRMKSVQLCTLHHNKIVNISKCQFCGNLTLIKYDLKEWELTTFQNIFDKDKLPVRVKKEYFICKPCRTYFLSRVSKTNCIKNVDYVKLSRTVITRICNFHNIQEFGHLLNNIEMPEKEYCSNVPNVRSQIPSGPIISKVFSTSEQVQPIQTRNVLPFKPANYRINNGMVLNSVRSVTNNEILSLQPMNSDTNQSSRLVMVSTLQSIQDSYSNRRNPMSCKNVSKLLTKNVMSSQNVRPCIKTKPVCIKPVNTKPFSKSPVSVPVNIPQFQTPINVGSTVKTAPIPSIQPRQSFNTLETSSSNTFTKKIRINKYALHLFKNLQNPFYTSEELLHHLLLLEKYRKEGVICKVNSTSGVEIENNNVEIEVKNDIQGSFQDLPKDL